jgi:hypothetical protein
VASASNSVPTRRPIEHPLPFPFYWIHPPKTGSTFGGVLAGAVCQGLDQVQSFYHPYTPAAEQQVKSSALMFRHFFGSMVPVMNATVEELSTTSWQRKIMLCELRPHRLSSFRTPAQQVPFSLAADDTYNGPQWSHGHNPLRGLLPIFMMVREPSARLVSAFKQGLPVMCQNQPAFKKDPCLSTDAFKLVAAANNGSRDILTKISSVSDDGSCVQQLQSIKYKKHSMLWTVGEAALGGCQTKMLLGRPCSSTLSLTREDVAAAVSKVRNPRKVVFAGDTDLWDLSVCTFWATAVAARPAAAGEKGIAQCPPTPLMSKTDLMHGRGIPIEVQNVSAILAARRTARSCSDPAAAVALMTHDVADEALFLEMRKRLLKDVKKHRLLIEACEQCPRVDFERL